MTRTLVIVIDRDDDLGVKAGLRGPVVGRRNVLAAALKLGIADPEESDTNAIFAALRQHDLILEEAGPEDAVEVAILTGDERVGVRSDRAIALQIEDVIETFGPDRAVMVSDGAEDESLLPIIQSRIAIDHVHRVVVRQSKGLEGTYYYIVKALDDPALQRRIVLPIALVFVTIGIGIAFKQAWLIGALPLILGIYLMARGLGMEAVFSRIVAEMNSNTDGAMVSTVLWSMSFISGLLAAATAWDTYQDLVAQNEAMNIIILTMIDGSLQWLIIAFLFAILGGLVLGARRGRFRGRLLVVMMFVLTIWEFSRTALTIAIDGLNGANYTFDPNTFIPDWGASLLFLTGAWLTWRTVRVVERRDEDGKRFHGV